jgi:hypothetical protein
MFIGLIYKSERHKIRRYLRLLCATTFLLAMISVQPVSGDIAAKLNLVARLAELAPPPQSPAGVPTEIGPVAQAKEKLSPCDAVIEFMKESKGLITQQKGKEGAKSLKQIKKRYAPRMQGAPAKAVKAAEDWVKEGTKSWDHVSALNIRERNRLLDVVQNACGKSSDSDVLRIFFSPKVIIKRR